MTKELSVCCKRLIQRLHGDDCFLSCCRWGFPTIGDVIFRNSQIACGCESGRCWGVGVLKGFNPWFPSSPLEIRVPLFLLFGFNKGTQREKRTKGSY